MQTLREPLPKAALGDVDLRILAKAVTSLRHDEMIELDETGEPRPPGLSKSANAATVISPRGGLRAAPAGHESQLAYGSPVFAAGGIPVRHRYPALADNSYATE